MLGGVGIEQVSMQLPHAHLVAPDKVEALDDSLEHLSGPGLLRTSRSWSGRNDGKIK